MTISHPTLVVVWRNDPTKAITREFATATEANKWVRQLAASPNNYKIRVVLDWNTAHPRAGMVAGAQQ